ncbi:uncharacterized protein LOC135223074 [Macrobrachium nipponense]|uniref:uncharacterized protein LOC135223074 n=1 Tax=Macrobrachium nipponense TaxID=159736 RepID=UPI0030C7FA5C
MARHGIPRLPKYLAAAGSASNFASEEQLQKTRIDTTSLSLEQPSHCPSRVPKQVQRNIMELLKCYPEGLEIEKFNVAYLKRFGRPLIASDYGFLDMVDLLGNLKGDILQLPYTNGQLLLKVDKDVSGEQCDSPQAHEKVEFQPVPNEIIEAFKTIVKKNGGGISLENLKYEFEMITHKQLDLASLGFSCLYDLVSSLGEIFNIYKSGSQFLLCDSNIKTLFLSDTTASVVDSHQISRTLSNETEDRLAKLLREEFPAGLTIDELVGAYKGLFGADLDDLNPLLYGYRTLQALLKDHPDVVLLIYANDTIMVYASQFLWPEEATKLTLSPVKTVSAGSVYQILDQSALLPIGEWIEVMVAEVYSPEKFWVIIKGSETSGALNCLMGKLFEFYSSKVGDRYMVSPGQIAIGAPVVAYFADEHYYCRALVTSVEDVRTVKLFLVDYGIVYRCDYSQLRQLHQNFFTLPAQAIKAALDDIVPPYGKGIWPKPTSQRFLNMVQNKDLVAKVTKLKENAYMELWDTSGRADINIAHALIVEGLAFSDSPLDCGNMPYKKSASDQDGARTGSNLKPLNPKPTRETIHSPESKLSMDHVVESFNCMNSIPSGNNLSGDGIRNLIFDTESGFSILDHAIQSETNCSQNEVRSHKLVGGELASCSNLFNFTQSGLVFSDPLMRKTSFKKEQEIQQHHQLSLIPNVIQQNEFVASQNLPNSRIKGNWDQGEEYTSYDQMDLQTLLLIHELRNLPEFTSFSPCRSEEKLMQITPQSNLESTCANILPDPSQLHTLKYVPPPPGFEGVGRFLPVSTHVETACPPMVSTSGQHDFEDHGR